MTVRALALTLRSLREGTRAKNPYFLRGALMLVLIFAIVNTEQQLWWSNTGGINLLSFVAWGNFVLITLVAVSAMSAIITEEKEWMTLGLLRQAGFSPATILLGKSAGTVLNSFLLLVVQLPFCILAITFGGVSLDQVVALFTMLCAHMAFVFGLALLASVVCQRSSQAAVLTLGSLIVYHALPAIVMGRPDRRGTRRRHLGCRHG